MHDAATRAVGREWTDVEREGAIATITLDRPPANAYTIACHAELVHAIDLLEADPRVRVVRLRSASPKFFSAGADLRDYAAGSVEARSALADAARRTCARIETSGLIFVAEIAGHALGGGLELALACDIRIASRAQYTLGLPEIALGLMPGNGGTQRLPRIVGRARAAELLLTGEPFTPEDALEWGLVTQLHDPIDFEERAALLARRISVAAPLALSATKRALQRGVDVDLERALEIEAGEGAHLVASADAAEGLAAFLEKRPPRFEGR
ncbi:3-hydroxybutyryl-CoA dehydratase [Agromyces rhizosphaerae]|uniref:enoyl-CoA hydratase n=1 Tax=Agromyces rhizosphaerae TaxID=88374 RepID=A0A9W6CPV9_9MICO|nr:enoyl-CoA hydratase-related protein [Agromyces rhizosphaerae]GLI26636.1 3-hydroxybutyryl-CoA dehydratase [Agromyces rhizosphaerae]